MKVYKIIFLRLTVLMFCFSLGQTAFAITEWPPESLSVIRSQNHGAQCTQCTSALSFDYCSSRCCASCMEEATQQSLNTSSACRNVCSLNLGPTQADQEIIRDCEANAFTTPGCAEVNAIVNPNESLQRAFERRVQSCNEAIANTNRFCTEAHLNSVYPPDLFRLAQDISNSPSCDFASVERYNLMSQSSNPQASLGLCEKNYTDCRNFCFDQNIATFQRNVGRSTMTNTEGHRKYEEECQPLKAEFENLMQIRQDVILQANQMAQSCQAPPSDRNDPGDPTNPTDRDDPEETAPGRLARALENPSAAFQNINGIISAIQPFMPQNQAPRPINSEVARSADPEGRRYGLTQEEYYGVDYEGAGGDADDFDFALDESFDQPSSLQPNPQSRGQNPGAGGGMGALGGAGMGQGGGAPGGGGSSAKKGRPRRRGQKDKSLFGKIESPTGGAQGFDVGAKAPNLRGGTARGRGNRTGDKSLNNKVFNPSKYHDLILASYEKGMNSEAQKRARRQAAGYTAEKRSRMGARGYTPWHLENKIHPETISLFMQARICYNTKYSSGFQRTCAFSP